MRPETPLTVECEFCEDTGFVTLPARTWYGGRGIGHEDGCACEACQTPQATAHAIFRRDPPPGEPWRNTVLCFPCRLCALGERVRRLHVSPPEPKLTGTLTREQSRRVVQDIRRRISGDAPGPTQDVPDDPPLTEAEWTRRRNAINAQAMEIEALRKTYR